MTPAPAFPATRDLLLIGGGHAHALILQAWAMRPLPGARLTLVSPTPQTAYSGMLPGAIAGLYDEAEIFLDLLKLCRAAGARFIIDRACGLDLARAEARLQGRPPIAFDVASIDTGAGSSPPPLADPLGRAAPVKPNEAFLGALGAFVEAVARADAPPRAAVIGGGVGGVETAFALQNRLRRALDPDRHASISVTLLARGPRVAPSLRPSASRAIARRLAESGITLATDAEATAITAEGAALADGRSVDAAFVAVAAGAQAPGWLAETGLVLDDAGFIAVDGCLQAAARSGAAGAPPVFAAGDVATIIGDAREKAGVYAVRAAKPLATNLRRALQGLPAEPARLQRRHLKLISLGDGRALAERSGVLIGGPPAIGRALWRLKDRIDRRFMEKLTPAPLDLAAAQASPPAHAAAGLRERLERAPLCAGCGSKIGRAALLGGLSSLGAARSEAAGAAVFVRAGAGDDAAILGFAADAPDLVISVDGFRAFTDDPRLFAEITVAHAFGDVFAMGAAPLGALASVTLPAMAPRLQARSLGELTGGLEDALGRIGARLIGGHSAEGAEWALSLTAIGQTAPGAAARLSGARPGDRLWLSRPIGSGVLLAAEMRREAAGGDVAALYQTLRRAAAEDAAALRAAGARAMTDVTGFGLAGHALSLAEASDVSLRLALGRIRTYPGAAALSARGLRSSLYDENRRLGAAELTIEPGASGPVLDLLFDPQTSGGILAALPPGAEVAPEIATPIGVAADPEPGRARVVVGA